MKCQIDAQVRLTRFFLRLRKKQHLEADKTPNQSIVTRYLANICAKCLIYPSVVFYKVVEPNHNYINYQVTFFLSCHSKIQLLQVLYNHYPGAIA